MAEPLYENYKVDRQSPKLMSIKEVCEYLGISRRTFYRLKKQGALPGFQIGSTFVVPRDVLAKWVEQSANPRQKYVKRSDV